ncbi:MAG: hypothetical protein DLM68_00430 [Hyphomicrobiales bacterium]|nr:MAG: hypothetical protein DLM68_00430 [Hyphomicrobiales bacterium]
MKTIPLTPEIEALALRIIWFESPAEALEYPNRFMTYAFARATEEDMELLRRYLDEADFMEALENACPGIIWPNQWIYWNTRFGRVPVPPMPERKLPDLPGHA